MPMTTLITNIRSSATVFLLAGAVFAGAYVTSEAQAPPPAPATVPAQGGGGGRGRGGLPGATPEQLQAVADMNASLASLTGAVAAARTALAAATYTEPRNAPAIAAAVEKVRATELALAIGRASRFASLQAGPHTLSADQVQALIVAGGVVAAPGNRARGAGTAPANPVTAGASAGPGRGN